MKLRSLLMLPVVVGATAIGSIAPHVIAAFVSPSPAAASVCADLILGVDGTGSVQDPHSIVKVKAGPGATIVRYPGSIFPIGRYSYDVSVRMGVDETKRIIRAFRALNPCGTLHLIGHSQGARVAGDAIAELYAEGMDTSFITAELLSDPRHPVTGVEVVFAGVRIPGYTMRGERSSFGEAVVFQRCTPGDPICDFPHSWWGLLNLVPDFARLHGAY